MTRKLVLRAISVTAVLILLLIISFFFGLTQGSIKIPPDEIIKYLSSYDVLNSDTVESNKLVILQIRLPRILLAACVGAALAMAGAAFQGLLRNPLADPYIIGTSSGAALGASIAIMLGISSNSKSFISPIPFMAFLGSLVSLILVYLIARKNKKLLMDTFLLAGVIVGSFMGALVSFVMVFAKEELPKIVFWLMGSLSGREDWKYIAMLLPYLIGGSIILYLYAYPLNLLTLGEDIALTKGIDVEKTKIVIILAASLITASAVSVSGLIGFVGLMIPHIIRTFTGPDHRLLIPSCAIAGAAFLISTDTLGRTIFSPEEVPVGVITALLGAPFFFWLLKTRKTYI